MKEEIKRMNKIYCLKKMTQKQKAYLTYLRLQFRKGNKTIEECHKLWEIHPDYIEQYGEGEK